MMFLDEIRQKVGPLARQVCRQAGMELVELKVTGHRNDIYIQVLADKPGGGIHVGECAIINKLLVSAIEKENFISREVFSLEVSSPGIDRRR